MRILLPEGTGIVLVERQPAWHVEAGPVFDFDDFGAEVREHAGGDGADAHPAEVGYADTGQRPAAGPGPALPRRVPRRRLLSVHRAASLGSDAQPTVFLMMKRRKPLIAPCPPRCRRDGPG